jgi:hypothetical protein
MRCGDTVVLGGWVYSAERKESHLLHCIPAVSGMHCGFQRVLLLLLRATCSISACVHRLQVEVVFPYETVFAEGNRHHLHCCRSLPESMPKNGRLPGLGSRVIFCCGMIWRKRSPVRASVFCHQTQRSEQLPSVLRMPHRWTLTFCTLCCRCVTSWNFVLREKKLRGMEFQCIQGSSFNKFLGLHYLPAPRHSTRGHFESLTLNTGLHGSTGEGLHLAAGKAFSLFTCAASQNTPEEVAFQHGLHTPR